MVEITTVAPNNLPGRMAGRMIKTAINWQEKKVTLQVAGLPSVDLTPEERSFLDFVEQKLTSDMLKTKTFKKQRRQRKT